MPYLASLLTSDAFRDRAAGMVTGTSKSHQRIQLPALLQSSWLMPDGAALSAFDSIAMPMPLRTDGAQRESDALAALRDTLLPKLISGELRIIDAQKRTAAA